MRVVLDTNIIARATASPNGPARTLLDLLDPPNHELILSEPMLQELAETLHYERLRMLHRLRDEWIEEYIVTLRSDSTLVEPPPIKPLSPDPDDDIVISTAIAGNAEVLCTLDRHLHHPSVKEFCSRRGIEILRDVELLDRIR